MLSRTHTQGRGTIAYDVFDEASTRSLSPPSKSCNCGNQGRLHRRNGIELRILKVEYG